MSIEIRDGDLLEQSDLDLIVHQANCFCTMGAGIAKRIADKFPVAIDADKRTKAGDKTKLGSYTCGVDKSGLHVINLYGQYRYGRERRHTDYDAVKRALIEIKDDYVPIDIVKPTYIGLPYKMGCVNGGGDWDVISSILTELFQNDNNFHLVICKI